MKGELKPTEPHPAVMSALPYLNNLGLAKLMRYAEVFASAALSGNRWAEICSETLDRLLRGDNVSDRYTLGLAWTILAVEHPEYCMITIPIEWTGMAKPSKESS